MDTVSVPSDVAALAVRLTLATVLGAAVGLNREMSLKPAGLRTHALVSLGAALLTYVGLQFGRGSGDMAAASRVVQGLIAGIGFIGGGAILHQAGGRPIHGLTTAASIWIVAATGVAVGAGLWRGATIAVVLTLIILTIGHSIDKAVRKVRGPDTD
jgi:putative Mg2+ transporter-C (MgtC) family protein